MQYHDVAFWKEEINDEMDSIMENNTWILSDLPPGCKPLGCKWIFKRKIKVDGTIDKFKAILVIQGFRQNERIDYFDTYAPVARISTIRLLIALVATYNLVIHQMDVNTTFLNGNLEEEVYMKQPKGFIVPGNEHKVFKFIKSLYELKKAPNQWHQKLDEVVLSSGRMCHSMSFQEATCIIDSIMEAKFVALAAAGKEAECASTLAKAYCQIYNGKSRHLDHLTKGLARDLVYKLAIGMGLKSIQISNGETPNSLLANARS
ncbi:zinc finger, CCHC-type containing protein [Tanacetum coccineum]